MRSFPRAARRRLLASTLAAVAIGGLFTNPAAQADRGHDLKKQQHHVQQQEKKAQGDLDGTSRQLIAARQALADARTQLGAARRHLASVNAQLVAAQNAHDALVQALTASRAALVQAQQDATAGQSSVDHQRDLARTAILQSYSAGDPQLAEAQALVDGSSLDDVARQQSYSAAVGQLQANSLQQLQSSQVLLSVHQKDVARVTTTIHAQEQQAAAKVAQIEQLRTQAVQAKQAVWGLVSKRISAARAASRIKAHDAKVLAQLKAKEIAIQKKILELRAKDANRTVASTNAMFLPPVSNTYITSPYGWRIHPIYHYWGLHDGDDLHAPCGTPEVAVDTGRVVEQYYSSVWGNRLYLDLGNVNGHNYTAIYNHISVYKSHVGEVVGRGQMLALAGTTGWSTACHLHFTIMRDGVAVDPTHLIGM